VSWAAWAAAAAGEAPREAWSDDRVVDGGLRDRQIAGDEHGAEPCLPDGVQRQLIPFEDNVGRRQVPILQ
jgi:hypothetical protein